jgi:hypothetical protein
MVSGKCLERRDIMTELAFQFLNPNTYYVSENGQVVQIYSDEKRLGQQIMEEWGCFTGHVGGIPGMQMWNGSGGHIGHVTQIYNGRRIKVKDLSLVDYATEEQIASYDAYKNSSLDRLAAEDFVSFEKFSAWMTENQNKELPDKEHAAVDIVMEYLRTWKTQDAFSLMFQSWASGGGYRYPAVAALEFIGQRYLLLPMHFRAFQKKRSHPLWGTTYSELFAGIYADGFAPVWRKNNESLTLTHRL